MAIYRGARKYAVTMGNLEISTGNQNLGQATTWLELEGAKKPKAKPSSSETMVLPGETGSPETSWSSDADNGRIRRSAPPCSR